MGAPQTEYQGSALDVSSPTNPLLVPIDFSPCSRSALRHACLLGEQLGATIDVVHIWAAPLYIAPDMSLEAPEGPGPTLWQYARIGVSREEPAR